MRDDLKVGDSASLGLLVDDELVSNFAEITLDKNPVHLDEEYAAKTRFGKRIAHGMIAAGLLSAVLGTKLPGPGAIFLHKSLDFLAPVFIGEQITAEVIVTKWRNEKRIADLDLRVYNGKGKEVVKGKAVILFEPV